MSIVKKLGEFLYDFVLKWNAAIALPTFRNSSGINTLVDKYKLFQLLDNSLIGSRTTNNLSDQVNCCVLWLNFRVEEIGEIENGMKVTFRVFSVKSSIYSKLNEKLEILIGSDFTLNPEEIDFSHLPLPLNLKFSIFSDFEEVYSNTLKHETDCFELSFVLFRNESFQVRLTLGNASYTEKFKV